MLDKQGWCHYSCDLEIGKRILGEEIEKTLGEPNKVTAADLSQLSRYVSRLGDIQKGALPYDEFKRRQKKYYDAECKSLGQLRQVVTHATRNGFTHTVNDSTGSLCEIDDAQLMDFIDENSLIVYIKASAEEEQEVLKRAQEYPKPMFFSPEKFDEWVQQYAADNKISAEEFDPDGIPLDHTIEANTPMENTIAAGFLGMLFGGCSGMATGSVRASKRMREGGECSEGQGVENHHQKTHQKPRPLGTDRFADSATFNKYHLG